MKQNCVDDGGLKMDDKDRVQKIITMSIVNNAFFEVLSTKMLEILNKPDKGANTAIINHMYACYSKGLIDVFASVNKEVCQLSEKMET